MDLIEALKYIYMFDGTYTNIFHDLHLIHKKSVAFLERIEIHGVYEDRHIHLACESQDAIMAVDAIFDAVK